MVKWQSRNNVTTWGFVTTSLLRRVNQPERARHLLRKCGATLRVAKCVNRARINDVNHDAERRATQLFDRVPKMAVVAKAYPDFMGARAPSYALGATDGSRPGTYQYPVVGVPLTKFGVRTVAYHEAVPGHHFQGALQAEDTALPRFQQDGVFGNNSAIGEGWGLYAERVVAEEGWYEGDLVGLLGQLDAEVFRARRLVVDTGLHAKRWTREQAIDYLGPNPAGSAAAEVERYASNPGQACRWKGPSRAECC